jgi:phosphoribosyl 1,2-cyclic phosphate phosphodiesterase
MPTTRTFTFLGTGTSVGIPMLGCDCATCHSPNPRNQRYRCSALIRLPQGNLLIDTTPELRLQLLRAHAKVIHAVLYTHYHADHLFGLDDLRPLAWKLGGPVPIYCTTEVESKIREAFAYAFGPHADKMSAGAIPKLVIRPITSAPFTVLEQGITPIPLLHAHFDVFGFRIGDLAYCTDVNQIPGSSWPLLEGVRILILDALRLRPHPAHFSLEEALAVIARLRPQQAFLTHIGHDLEHEAISERLPSGTALAYDGLEFEF